MSKAQKLLAKMRQNPRDWRIEEVRTVARAYGVTWMRPAGGSSHETYWAEDDTHITVVDKKPIKPVYIIKFVEFVEEIDI